jgi:hypothetical protein
MVDIVNEMQKGSDIKTYTVSIIPSGISEKSALIEALSEHNIQNNITPLNENGSVPLIFTGIPTYYPKYSNYSELLKSMMNYSNNTLTVFPWMEATDEKLRGVTNILECLSEYSKTAAEQLYSCTLFLVNVFDDFLPAISKFSNYITNTNDCLKVEYRLDNSVSKPLIFPVAIMSALRMRQKGNFKNRDVSIFNNNPQYHLENYAPKSLNKEVTIMLDEARSKGDAVTEALIHTGIISLELAIRKRYKSYVSAANPIGFFKRLDGWLSAELDKRRQNTNNESTNEQIQRGKEMHWLETTRHEVQRIINIL